MPEKFGVVAIDCAKARSTWRLTDFYGNVLTQSASVEHNRSRFQVAVLTLKQAIEKHDIKDLIVADEMTGTYHQPPMRAFRDADSETLLVLAGEMGPIENYASAKAVGGRAGLFPARFRSDEVDRSGKMTR